MSSSRAKALVLNSFPCQAQETGERTSAKWCRKWGCAGLCSWQGKKASCEQQHKLRFLRCVLIFLHWSSSSNGDQISSHGPIYVQLINKKQCTQMHINIAPTCFGLRPSSGSLYRAWLNLYFC